MRILISNAGCVLLELLSVASRFFNVLHLGKANETFSERTERCKAHWYFNGWRVAVNLLFGLFGQKNHTLMVTISESADWKKALRDKGYAVRKKRSEK